MYAQTIDVLLILDSDGIRLFTVLCSFNLLLHNLFHCKFSKLSGLTSGDSHTILNMCEIHDYIIYANVCLM